MKFRILPLASLLSFGSLWSLQFFLPPLSAADPAWTKVVINDQSPFEACGVGDFNGDGKVDIFSGDSWYQAPDWTRHKVRDVQASRPNPHYYEDFADAPLDVNGDGRPDIVTCNYFGARLSWVENPGGDSTNPWPEHEIDSPGNMETGELVDITGDGKPEFLPNPGNTVVWYELTQQKPEVVWSKHDLGAEGAGHGVGVGDINRDGRLDIITPKGWYEQPPDRSQRWPFHAEFDLGAAGIFIHGDDFDGDGLTDLVWGMGHDFGLSWLKQEVGSDEQQTKGIRSWRKIGIDATFSQVHTLLFAEIDGQPGHELVTGKRVYAHETEPGATDSSCVYYFTLDRSSGQWTRHLIFEGTPAQNAPAEAQDRWALHDFPQGSVGTGLQMAARDMDGDGDIDLVCPGKSGLYLLKNPRF